MARKYTYGNPMSGGANTSKGFPGTKALSTARHGAGSGKMSAAHGTGPSSPTKGMRNANTSGTRVGAGKQGFSSGHFKQGPCPIGKHGKVDY